MTGAGESSLHGGFAWGCIFFINTRQKQLPEKAAVFFFCFGARARRCALAAWGVQRDSPAGYILFWPDGTIGSERDRRDAR